MRFQPVPFLCLTALAFTLPPQGLADTLLVANKSDHTVDLIDLESGKSVVTLPTGPAPHEIAVSKDGSLAVITNYGDREQPGNTLTVIDIAAARVLRTIDLGAHQRPHGVIFVGPESVAVTTEGSAHLAIVDIAEGRVATAVGTGQETSHMVTASASGDRAFVANIGSGTVTVIDLREGRKLTDLSTGEGAEGIALSPDGQEIWVGNRAADTLSIIDPETLEIVATLPCLGFPIRIAFTPDGDHALVSAARSGEVVLFDTRRRLEVKRAKLDLNNAPDASKRLFGDRFGDSPVPVGLVTSPDGATAWVAATQADVVVVIDAEQLVVTDLLQAGHEPDGMAHSRVPVRVPIDPGR